MPRKAKVSKIDEPIEEVSQVKDVPQKDVVAPKIKKERKENKWITHCRTVKVDNPDLSYRDILKLAKESYVK